VPGDGPIRLPGLLNHLVLRPTAVVRAVQSSRLFHDIGGPGRLGVALHDAGPGLFPRSDDTTAGHPSASVCEAGFHQAASNTTMAPGPSTVNSPDVPSCGEISPMGATSGPARLANSAKTNRASTSPAASTAGVTLRTGRSLAWNDFRPEMSMCVTSDSSVSTNLRNNGPSEMLRSVHGRAVGFDAVPVLPLDGEAGLPSFDPVQAAIGHMPTTRHTGTASL
jgi:hypothetical protein